MAWRRLRSLSPRTILAIGWGLFAIHAYPGLMAADSFSQLAGARSCTFTGDEPPMLQAIWAVLDRIIAGPFPMLALQSMTFVVGAFLLARRLVQPRAAALCAVLVLLSPPVLATIAVVCTHALLAGLVLLGAACVVDERARIRGIGIGVLAVAAAVRYNAPIATLPVLVSLLATRLQGVSWRRHAIAFAVWVATVVAACGANAALSTRSETTPANELDTQSYIHQRLDQFASVLGLDEPQPIVSRVTQSAAQLQAFEIQQAHGAVQRISSRIVDGVSHTFVFRPWFYYVLAVALLVKLRRVRELSVLLASGLAVELSLIYYARDADYRNSHWLVTCALLTAAVAIARRFRPLEPPAAIG